MTSTLDTIEGRIPRVRHHLERQVDLDLARAVVQDLADTPAPSQTAAVTRGPIVARLVNEWGMDDAEVTIDTRHTGTVRVARGEARTRLIAHLDEISYLLAEPIDDQWLIEPFCYHLADGPRSARVVRLSSNQQWSVVAEGEVVPAAGALRLKIADDSQRLQPGDRVALHVPFTEESGGRYMAAIDNAAGVAAVLLAARTVDAMGLPYELILPDEEEGPAGRSSQTISRGAARTLHDARLTDLDVVVDTHGLPQGVRPGQASHEEPWGASLTEFSSHARGAVTPPLLYRWLADLAADLNRWDVALKPNHGGYIPRSDDVISTLRSRSVAIIGYPGSNRHFDTAPPTGNLNDLIHLARALSVIVASIELGEGIPT